WLTGSWLVRVSKRLRQALFLVTPRGLGRLHPRSYWLRRCEGLSKNESGATLWLRVPFEMSFNQARARTHVVETPPHFCQIVPVEAAAIVLKLNDEVPVDVDH